MKLSPSQIDPFVGIVMWRNQPHGQYQVVGSTLKLEPFLSRKEKTKEGYRAPRPLEVRRGVCMFPRAFSYVPQSAVKDFRAI